jgi:hypothetical protein
VKRSKINQSNSARVPDGGEGGDLPIVANEAIERHGADVSAGKLESREPASLRQARRCLARTRRGTPCQSPATPKGRCRMHGGAPGSGGPKGQRNGMWKHGKYSQEMVELRREVRRLMHEAKEALESF